MDMDKLDKACKGYNATRGGLNVPELKQLARQRGHTGINKMNRGQLLKILCDQPKPLSSLNYRQLWLILSSDVKALSLSETQQSERAKLKKSYHPNFTRLIKAMTDKQPKIPNFKHGKSSYPINFNYIPQPNPFTNYGHYPDMHLFRIKAGTIFYHGSKVNIDDFDRLAFFSLIEGASKSLMVAGRAYNTKPRVFNDINLHRLRLKHDIVLIYNQHIWGECEDLECSPIDPNASMASFCEMMGAHGFFQMRGVAPLPPIKLISKEERTKVRRQAATFDSYFENYVDYNTLTKDGEKRKKWYFVDTKVPEIVLCDPRRILELVEVTTISGRDIIEQQRLHVLNLMDKIEQGYIDDIHHFESELMCNW